MCIHTYVHTYIHTYIPTLYTYIHTYIRTYDTRTYIHTYIYTYVFLSVFSCSLPTHLCTYVHATYLPTVCTYVHAVLSFMFVFCVYSSGVEDSYLHTIAVIYLDCLKLLTFCLRSALAMSREKGKRADLQPPLVI